MRVMAAVVLVASMLAGAGVSAGETADFNGKQAEAWSHYRAAFSHAGRENGTAAARSELSAFLESWRQLQARWGTTPPPQYSEDGEWKETIEAVGTIARRALTELDRDAPDDAREMLAEIKAVMAGLRRRNGVVAFTDTMNEFSDALAEAIGDETPSTKSASARRDQLAVLSYLAERIQKNAPQPVQSDPDFPRMSENLVANIQRAKELADGKGKAVDRALLAVRASFDRLFLKFG